MLRGGPGNRTACPRSDPIFVMIWVWFRGPRKTLEPQVPKPLLSAPLSHARSLECVHGPQGSWPSPQLCTQPGDHRQWLDLQGPVDNIAHDQQHHTVLEGSRGVGTEMGEEGQGGKREQPQSVGAPTPTRGARAGEGGPGEPGRYHVERPAALPDAVCVEHVEDATANP